MVEAIPCVGSTKIHNHRKIKTGLTFVSPFLLGGGGIVLLGSSHPTH